MQARAVTFSGSGVDRALAARKDDAWVRRLLNDPSSAAVAASSEGVLLDAGAPPRLLRLPAGEAVAADPSDSEAILLGLDRGQALFAVDLDAPQPGRQKPATARGRLVSLRDAGAALCAREAGLAGYLVALLNWHRAHCFCADCGAPTEVAEAGSSRRCTRFGTEHFPRTDPAVIVLVESDEQVLLGRQRDWEPGSYSVLAGFVAPGESLEEAVSREVYEESGIRIKDAAFVASQPWPFPSSLMLGFHAHGRHGQPRAQDGELEDVRWFTRAEVGRALAGEPSGLDLPPRISIARLLIERWYEAVS
jgi:NAD+ diphosphatase